MFGLTILDLVLILTLLSYLFHGLRNGFLVTVGGIAGFAAGAVAAFVSVPIVSGLVEDSGWRLTAIIATAVLLMMLGHGLGTAIGRSVRSAVKINPLRSMDRLAGGGVNVVVSALVMSMLAFSIGALGVPFVSQPLAESKVIRFIDGVTPVPLKTSMAQLRSAVIGEGIPTLFEGIGEGQPVAIPDTSTDTPALNRAVGVGPEDRRHRLPVRTEPDRDRFRGLARPRGHERPRGCRRAGAGGGDPRCRRPARARGVLRRPA